MTTRVFFESDSFESQSLFVWIDQFELFENGRWVSFVFTESGGVQTVPSERVRQIVLESDMKSHDDLAHVIHFVDGEGDDEHALASVYELREGWVEYVDRESEQRVLVPPHRIEAIAIDLGESEE